MRVLVVNFLEASRNWEVEKLRNLHDLSLTYPLKNDRWKITFLSGWLIFRGELLNLQGVMVS